MRFLSFSSWTLSSLNFFLMFMISSSLLVSWRLTSMILLFNSSSSWMIRSSRLYRSVAFWRTLLSKVLTLWMESPKACSRSASRIFHVLVTSSIFSISFYFKCAKNFAISARFHISNCQTTWSSAVFLPETPPAGPTMAALWGLDYFASSWLTTPMSSR